MNLCEIGHIEKKIGLRGIFVSLKIKGAFKPVLDDTMYWQSYMLQLPGYDESVFLGSL